MDFSKYVGIEYRDPDSEGGDGLHCWELVELVMRDEFVMQPPKIEFKGHYKEASPVFLSELENWTRIPQGEESAGDMALFAIGGYECHCGIIIDSGAMLHCMRGRGAVIERYSSPQWAKRLLGFYRWGN